MKITDVWSLHYENFIIQIDATAEEEKDFKESFEVEFPNKNLIINNVRRTKE